MSEYDERYAGYAYRWNSLLSEYNDGNEKQVVNNKQEIRKSDYYSIDPDGKVILNNKKN